MEDLFISALVRAGTCQKHAIHTRALSQNSSRREPWLRPQRKKVIGPHGQTRKLRAAVVAQDATGAAAASAGEITREEFRDVVNPYSSFSDHLQNDQLKKVRSNDLLPDTKGPLDVLPPPKKNIEATDNIIILKDERQREEVLEKPIRQRNQKRWFSSHPDHRKAIETIKLRLDDPLSSHEELYELYNSLPAPRAPYLPRKTLGLLLHHLSIVPRKTEARMLRYLSLLDDLKAADIPVYRSQYTSAIAFVGQAFSPVTDESVASAIRIYRTLEAEQSNQFGEPNKRSLASHATFTALFDVAAKSQKFALAEVIAREMDHRKLRPCRYYRVSRILFEGLRGDGEGVRRAYQELVDNGEIVDTVVINCVMSGLIRVGEIANAEMVFERMKRLDLQKREAVSAEREEAAANSPLGWRKKRDLGRLLNKAGRELWNNPEVRNRFQNASPITPDAHSYSLFLRYHAHTAGNIDRVSELLHEMHASGVSVDNRIYKILFHGFALHGGVRYTSWKLRHLDKMWENFLEAQEQGSAASREESKELDEDAIRFDTRLAWAVLSAYAKCAKQHRTLEVWACMKEIWKPNSEELEKIHRGLAIKFRNTV